MKLANFIGILFLFSCLFSNTIVKSCVKNETLPMVMITWDYENAITKAWDVIYNQKRSALDAIEEGCTLCEAEQCRKTVGFGGSPDENGETTLDALIIDGETLDMGAVAGMRRIKNAISVARKVMHHTKHTLLSGDLATEFAVKMGFKEESLTTNQSHQMWEDWKANNCQSNFWKNVEPDPKTSCGAYKSKNISDNDIRYEERVVASEDHDTIGILAIDLKGRVAAGTSTNGLNHKIPGRVGDTPIPGAGAYADQEVGAAACTGDGDVMIRFVPSFLAVELMRRGATPSAAAQEVINRIIKGSPKFFGAIIVMNIKGEYGVACNGEDYKKAPIQFPFWIANPISGKNLIFHECNNFL
ncbi:N(4)-(Beta-N-acetylglucosaminyl)-L-asparaginase [Camponotus floridanus]|uniref:N(4)-(beta-N-acetylglucosaminyl)-L-asparaginase n=1 Tax=Camponotus floridanus TaxID=104421 RepID=E2A3S0_CAMFO|nr:N(4)-(Beta-N-acetylglucosaminyl)-L-asparaginase [Camponotus floridanus]